MIIKNKRVVLGNGTVDVRECSGSSGRPIVMVHGIGVSGTYFLRLADELSRDYTVFIVDLPGYGKTPKPSRPLDIPQLAQVLDELVDYYHLEQPVLIGQSMGSQIVAQLANTNATKYSAIILIGPTVNRKEANRKKQGMRLVQDTLREPLILNTIIFRDYARMGMIRYLITSSSMIKNRIEDNIKQYTGRVFVTRGKHDPISPRDWCEHLADIAQDGSFAEITGAAHVAQYTKPKELADLCRKFL